MSEEVSIKFKPVVSTAARIYAMKLSPAIDHQIAFFNAIAGESKKAEADRDMESISYGDLAELAETALEKTARYWPLFVEAAVENPDKRLLDPNAVDPAEMAVVMISFFNRLKSRGSSEKQSGTSSDTPQEPAEKQSPRATQ